LDWQFVVPNYGFLLGATAAAGAVLALVGKIRKENSRNETLKDER